MPLLAAVIVSGGRLRRVYFLSTTLAVIDVIVCAMGPESLEPSRRKPLKLRTAHPLSFLRLFTHGRKLRRLAIMQFLGNCSEGGHGTDPPEQIANLHRSCVAVAASNALRAPSTDSKPCVWPQDDTRLVGSTQSEVGLADGVDPLRSARRCQRQWRSSAR